MESSDKYSTEYTTSPQPHHPDTTTNSSTTTPPPPPPTETPSGSMPSACNANSNFYNHHSHHHHHHPHHPVAAHPALRYPQSGYRLGGGAGLLSPPVRYTGIGPQITGASSAAHLQMPPHPSLYHGYDMRYATSSYSNLSSNGATPLYPYSNSNGFSYGHLNSRDTNRYYNYQQQQPQPHYDSYGRLMAATAANGYGHGYSAYHHHHHPHHQNYRELYDPIAGMHHAVRHGGGGGGGGGAGVAGPSPAYHHPYGHHYHHHHPLSVRTIDYQAPHLQHLPPNSLYAGQHPHHHHHHPDYPAQQHLEHNSPKVSMFDSRTPSDQDETDDRNKSPQLNGRNSRAESTPPDESNAATNNSSSNSDLAASGSPMTNGSASSCADSGISSSHCSDSLNIAEPSSVNSSSYQQRDDPDGSQTDVNVDTEGESIHEEREIKLEISAENHHEVQSSEGEATAAKETKPKIKNQIARTPSDEIANQIPVTSATTKRKLDSSTPKMDTSPIPDHSTIPSYLPHQHHYYQHHYHHPAASRYLNSPPAGHHNLNNYSPHYPNGYPISSASNGNWSPYSSPHYNWTYPPSPVKQPIRKAISRRNRNRHNNNNNTTTANNSNNNHQRYQSAQQNNAKQKSKTPIFVRSKNRVLECDFIPSKKSRRKIKSEPSEDSFEFREEIMDIKPLPGFQQAFGSTEIGRFSEIFFNTPEIHCDNNLPYGYESEADTMSPYPWETGDSLEGPHFNLHIGASVKSVYSSSSIDSQLENNLINNNNGSSYFSRIRCNEI